jgi:hypothetical protein
MYSSVELFARLPQLSPDKLPRTEGMLSFKINSLQEGVSANEGFRLIFRVPKYSEIRVSMTLDSGKQRALIVP